MPPSQPDPLARLEAKRSALLSSLANLQDMRRGSVVGAVRRCGKPTCSCAQPDDPGHGPHLRLTYKSAGKTVTEALPTPAAVRKAQHEIAAFRRFQQWSREWIAVSEQICRLRPVEQTLSEQEKKRRK